MTLKEAIDILEKELECRNRLIEDAEYGVENSCLFECTTCEYNTDSTKARDALSLLLDVTKKMEERDDLISRQAAIDELWKALYKYEDETEKQFQESDELDVGDWILHRMFVQNMSDIDRCTILNLPSAQPDPKEPCSACEGLENGDTLYAHSDWDGGIGFDYIRDIKYCPVCGRKLNNG